MYRLNYKEKSNTPQMTEEQLQFQDIQKYIKSEFNASKRSYVNNQIVQYPLYDFLLYLRFNGDVEYRQRRIEENELYGNKYQRHVVEQTTLENYRRQEYDVSESMPFYYEHFPLVNKGIRIDLRGDQFKFSMR